MASFLPCLALSSIENKSIYYRTEMRSSLRKSWKESMKLLWPLSKEDFLEMLNHDLQYSRDTKDSVYLYCLSISFPAHFFRETPL